MAKRPSLRRAAVVMSLSAVLIAAGAAALTALFPWEVRAAQNRQMESVQYTLERLRAENERLKEQIEATNDPIVMERVAREQLYLTREGDKLYRLVIDTSDIVILPDPWPFPGLAHLMRPASGP